MNAGTVPGEGRLISAPILIIGAPRSGTTLLGNLLATHPDIAYWEEPRTIWSQGNAWRPDDCLDETHLAPEIARRIDGRFARFLVRSGRSRFCEKTPSNCLRLRFIQALYPDARIIHLVRDGRAVVASMARMLEKPPDSGRIAARLRETPWRDLPALVPVFFRDVISKWFRKGKKPYWGPRPTDWREWLDLPVPLLLARQWRVLVERARADLELFPAGQRLEVRYEDLVSDPVAWLKRIGTVTGIPLSLDFVNEAANRVSPERADEWRTNLDPTKIEQIEKESAPLLQSLGYSLSSTNL